jgi:hypothetical protein
MSFDITRCAEPTLYCGDGDMPVSKDPLVRYIRAGSRYECLKKGFGAGAAQEKKKNLSPTSLQNIKFVGETYEANFKRNKIKTLTDLQREARNKSPAAISTLLKKILTKKNGGTDSRAYNAVLVYLYQHGNDNLPSCVRLSSR